MVAGNRAGRQRIAPLSEWTWQLSCLAVAPIRTGLDLLRAQPTGSAMITEPLVLVLAVTEGDQRPSRGLVARGRQCCRDGETGTAEAALPCETLSLVSPLV
jgi:hypothetical protein